MKRKAEESDNYRSCLFPNRLHCHERCLLWFMIIYVKCCHFKSLFRCVNSMLVPLLHSLTLLNVTLEEGLQLIIKDTAKNKYFFVDVFAVENEWCDWAHVLSILQFLQNFLPQIAQELVSKIKLCTESSWNLLSLIFLLTAKIYATLQYFFLH